MQAVVAADFEKAGVALAVIEIPFEGCCHRYEAIRTEDAGFFGEGIRKASGRDPFRAE